MEFICKRCGRCCRVAGPVLYITEEDVQRWRIQNRFDIIDNIFPVRFSCEDCNTEWGLMLGKKCPRCQKEGKAVFYWVDSRYVRSYLAQLMGNPRCPFLKK